MDVVASRYARALIEALSQEDSPGPDAGYEQLGQIQVLLATEPDARKILINPVVPAERRNQFLNDIGDALGLDSRVGKLFQLMVDRRRLEILDDLVSAYRELLDERNGIVRAVVTAAYPLEDFERQAIVAKLEKSLRQRVVLEVREDRTLIGGLVVRIGSTVYDGSLFQHLTRFKQRLLAG